MLGRKQANESARIEVPVLPLRDAVAFPHTTAPFAVNRSRSVALVEHLPADDAARTVVLALQHEPGEADPGLEELHAIGTLARVLHVAPIGQEGQRGYVLLAAGLRRVRLLEQVVRDPYLKARIEMLGEVVPDDPDPEYLALRDSLRKLFGAYVEKSPNIANEVAAVVADVDDAAFLSDFVASAIPRPSPERQVWLEAVDVRQRMRLLIEELIQENDKLDLENKIQSDIRQKIAGSQREHFLREQLAAIQRELGEGEDGGDVERLRHGVESAHMPQDARKEADRELARLARIPEMSPEHAVVRNYLDWLVSLPWDRRSGGDIQLPRAEQILDEDHYDLEKVKQRILEFLAVLRLQQQRQASPSRGELRGPILCFVGPPGVGKTSLGRSIARALGREFGRVSLGGVHDESELRGHRRTYVGAMPGQIIQTLRRVGTSDPVLMLDEVDKLGRDFRGDPAAALLEILDPEQNATFRDHYLDLPFDLSRILFVCTANVLDPVPPPLLDRMEVLELSGYSEEEKLQIAVRYLVPKQARENGLALGEEIRFTEEGLREIVRHYTREAGVRELERQIGSVCRKQARRILSEAPAALLVTPEAARSELGPPRHRVETEIAERTSRPGVAVGLAWTPVGGEILFVEASLVKPGRGNVTLTGQLGQVMQESARAAITWLRSHAELYGIEADTLRDADLHIHVPAGAVPKDGPSAGLVLVAALVSAATGQRARSEVAMTGEITLSGEVLPVGGIRDKLLAARRSGIREIVLPRLNDVNVTEDIPGPIRDEMTFHLVSAIEDAMTHVFGPALLLRAPAHTDGLQPAVQH
ncbi:MAG TPA: endopeptidase La [Polyangia bacterium]|nr:endopeptidase La [Polyangia bacterium]